LSSGKDDFSVYWKLRLFEDKWTRDGKTIVVIPKLFFLGMILSPEIMWWDRTSD
jgi:hypothetical protein